MNKNCNPLSSPTATEIKEFDIRDHLDKLIPAKGKDRYHCPSCEGHNLTIDIKTGKYQCWNGCECKDIREAIAHIAKLYTQRRPTDCLDWIEENLGLTGDAAILIISLANLTAEEVR